MKDSFFSHLLQDCLDRLDQGEDLRVILADFPEHADALKPLLLVAMASRAFPVPVPRHTAQRLGKNQMLAEMDRLARQGAFREKTAVPLTSRWMGALIQAYRRLGVPQRAFSYQLAMLSLVVVLSGGFLTLTASASSKPGDLLFTLKQQMQRVGSVLIYDYDDQTQNNSAVGYNDQSLRVIENLTTSSQTKRQSLLDPSSSEIVAIPDSNLSAEREVGFDSLVGDRNLDEYSQDEIAGTIEADLEEVEEEKEEEKEEKEEEKEVEKEEKEEEKEEKKEEKEEKKEEKEEKKEQKKLENEIKKNKKPKKK